MVPIITHPERNQILLRKPDMVLEICRARLSGAGYRQLLYGILGKRFEEDGGVAAPAGSGPRDCQRRA